MFLLISLTLSNAFSPRIFPPLGLTGNISPVYSYLCRYSNGNLPIAPTRSVAPIIATDLAAQSAEIELLELFKGSQTLQSLEVLQHPRVL